MDDTPRMEGKHVISVHIAKFKNGEISDESVPALLTVTLGPPTQAKAYKTLLQQEMQELSGTGKIGNSNFVNNGLRLECDQ